MNENKFVKRAISQKGEKKKKKTVLQIFTRWHVIHSLKLRIRSANINIRRLDAFDPLIIISHRIYP